MTPSLATLKPSPPLQRNLSAGLLVLLAGLCCLVLFPFAGSLAWATVLAYVSWPVYRLVHRICRAHDTLAATVMTLLVALFVFGPLSWLVVLLQSQLSHVYDFLVAPQTAASVRVPELIRRIPWLGAAIERAFGAYQADPGVLRQWVIDWLQRSRPQLLDAFGSVTRSLAQLLVTAVIGFFLYRDGNSFARQAARLVHRFFGAQLDRYIAAAAGMTRAVMYGYLSTAILQGAIATAGFAIFGIAIPLVLGALTALASVVPIFGTFLVWGSASLWLMLTGHLWQGIGLLAWGTLLVNPVDNILRPLLISNSARIPFLLVLFGAFGGVAAFGAVGVFVGPAVLAIATAVWRELLGEETHLER